MPYFNLGAAKSHGYTAWHISMAHYLNTQTCSMAYGHTSLRVCTLVQDIKAKQVSAYMIVEFRHMLLGTIVLPMRVIFLPMMDVMCTCLSLCSCLYDIVSYACHLFLR